MEGNIHKLRWSPDGMEARGGKKTRESVFLVTSRQREWEVTKLFGAFVADRCGIETHRVREFFYQKRALCLRE